MTQPVRALVVGAGAVGQVYARHLQLGGAEVTLFVREAYRASAARGFTLYPLNAARPRQPVRFEPAAVIARPDEVAARRFDLVILTVASPALAGAWLRDLIAAAGDATIVTLQPGLDDRDVILAAGAPAERLVSGMITLIGYAAPLPGETGFAEPGTAYWFPPLAPCALSGPRADRVVRALRAGQLPARRVADAARASAFPSAILMPYLVALETAGWSFEALWRHPARALAARAAREALAVTAAALGHRPPIALRLAARPGVLRVALWAARRVVPLPLEPYVRAHFTKVHAQTLDFMAGYVARGERAGVATSALAELRAGVA